MGPGTLYGSLGRMMEAGLIRESDKKVDPELDAQVLVPVIALIFWKTNFAPGVLPVFGLNAFFAMLFVVSALLFRGASANRL